MRGGVFRHRVRIVEVVSGRDSAGQPNDTLADVATVWAEVRDLRGREYIEAQQVPGGEVTTVVRIRYREGITRQMHVVHDGHLYDIEAVQEPTGRSRELLLMCIDRGDVETALGDGDGDG